MAPLARFLVDKGYTVFGWDDFATEERKKQLSFVHWQKTLPVGCDMCVYSSAVDENNALRRAAQSVCLCMPRGAFVAQLLKNKRLCAICGSHGKSTTTAYLIHFFKQHNIPVNYLGGAEFRGNAYEVGCGKHENVWILLELDESDGTIEDFSPDVTVILNTDWDHPRRYASAEAYRKVFEALASRTRKCVISNEYFPQFYAEKLRIPSAPTFSEFDATAAGVAFRYLTGKTVTTSDVASFPGVKRRQEVLLQTRCLKVLSDYAHHPSELKELLRVFEEEKTSLVIAFEPHRASRLKCYFKGFVRELKHCPRMYIHSLYEAFEAVDCNEKTLLDALPNAQPSEQLKPEDYIACEQPTTLAFVGAGEIDAYARRWVEQWTQAVAEFFATRGVVLETNVSLQNASLMGIGGSALFVCEPRSLHELQTLLRECRRIGLKVLPLGGGSNVLIPENRIDGVVVRMNKDCWNFCTFGAKTTDPNASDSERVNFLEALPSEISGEQLYGISVQKNGTGVSKLRQSGQDLVEAFAEVKKDETIGAVTVIDSENLSLRSVENNQIQTLLQSILLQQSTGISSPSQVGSETSEAFYVYVGCGTGMQAFLEAAEAYAVGGFEFLDGIPGTVGGALAVNAGTGGQGILDVAEQVVWVDVTGMVRITAHAELKYGYRYCETFKSGVIMSALLKGCRSTTERIRLRRAELRRKREHSQPKGKTLGCFFKNPQSCSAGRLLEQCGAKGKRSGEIFVSSQHANFIVNGGNGRFEDVIHLVKQLRTMVHERSGVWLEPEVRLLGGRWEEFL